MLILVIFAACLGGIAQCIMLLCKMIDKGDKSKVPQLLIALLFFHIVQYNPLAWQESVPKPSRVIPTDAVSKAVINIQDYLVHRKLIVNTSLIDGSITVLYRVY